MVLAYAFARVYPVENKIPWRTDGVLHPKLLWESHPGLTLIWCDQASLEQNYATLNLEQANIEYKSGSKKAKKWSNKSKINFAYFHLSIILINSKTNLQQAHNQDSKHF